MAFMDTLSWVNGFQLTTNNGNGRSTPGTSAAPLIVASTENTIPASDPLLELTCEIVVAESGQSDSYSICISTRELRKKEPPKGNTK